MAYFFGPPCSRDVVLGTRTRVQLEYKFLVLVLIDKVLVLVLVTTVLVFVRTVLDPSFDCISFLKEHSQLLDKLYFPAIRAPSVAASSCPIERVFSKGGLIMRPLKSKMSHSRVSELIFLKCNSSV